MKVVGEFCPTSKDDWRSWLMENHLTKQGVWLICHKKKSASPTLSWSDAVDVALCFGWIDSVRKTIDADRFIQFYGPRKPKGTWSKINKEKIQVLLEAGLMAPAGIACVERAKQNGSWESLDEVETLTVPPDLEVVLLKNPVAMDFFEGLSKSVRKSILHWVLLAKRPETKQKRIDELIQNGNERKNPFHLQ